jgi:hypothetical protein
MNDLTQTLLRSVLKIGAGYAIAKGLISDSEAETVTASVVAILGVLWGVLHRSKTVPPVTPKLSALLALGTAALLFTGCHTTAQSAAFQTAGTTTVTVEVALHAYNQFAAAGKTSVAQNLAVKNAYEKYQLAAAAVCDAGAIYAAANTTNSPPASAALQQAVLESSTAIADLMTLLRSIGVKI